MKATTRSLSRAAGEGRGGGSRNKITIRRQPQAARSSSEDGPLTRRDQALSASLPSGLPEDSAESTAASTAAASIP